MCAAAVPGVHSLSIAAQAHADPIRTSAAPVLDAGLGHAGPFRTSAAPILDAGRSGSPNPGHAGPVGTSARPDLSPFKPADKEGCQTTSTSSEARSQAKKIDCPIPPCRSASPASACACCPRRPVGALLRLFAREMPEAQQVRLESRLGRRPPSSCLCLVPLLARFQAGSSGFRCRAGCSRQPWLDVHAQEDSGWLFPLL